MNMKETFTLSVLQPFLLCIWQLKHVSHICIVLTISPADELSMNFSVCSPITLTLQNWFKITIDICGVKSLVNDKVMDYQG